MFTNKEINDMKIREYKLKENKRQSVANAISKRQNSSEPTSIQIVDNRPLAIQMRNFGSLANNNQHQNQNLGKDHRAYANSNEQYEKKVKPGFGLVNHRHETIKHRRYLLPSNDPTQKTPVIQRAQNYAHVTTKEDFRKKHLHSNPSQEQCGAMLIARKYRGWKTATDTHTLIDQNKIPEAAPLSGPVSNYTRMDTKKMKMIDRVYIASDPSEETQGILWKAITKTSMDDVTLAGRVEPLTNPQNYSNGQDQVECKWEICVDHLKGTGDKGLNPTTIEWLAASSEYRVEVINRAPKNLAKARVHQ